MKLGVFSGRFGMVQSVEGKLANVIADGFEDKVIYSIFFCARGVAFI